MTDVERVNAFANGGPFTWRAEDGSTDFNAMRADLRAALSRAAREPATADVKDRVRECLAKAVSDAGHPKVAEDIRFGYKTNVGSGMAMKAMRAFADDEAALSRAAPSSGHAMAEGERQSTVAFVQEWLMSSDHSPTKWDRDFAAAIDARCATTPPTTNDAIPAGMDQRCGFNGGTALDAPKSPEWLAACEKLALQYDRWNMKDKAAQIRSGHPGWLIEQACVEALIATPKPSPTPKGGLPGLGEVERLALEAIKAVAATSKDSAKILSRIMAIATSAGVEAQYSELLTDPRVALIVDRPRAEWRHLFAPACTIPPEGWRCTRKPGHDGPCAAVSLAPAEAIRDGGEGGEG